ncbi:queuine tRNA-ribosyltransferase accessory subunit 2 [Coccinella septempunctata]|uniref:queuine tRNA-ribosyltransferase accessory subunit 2 n=1 Tax=Coccinella septempunctata TaxID=41139 RepID=UPI001D067AB3|nr:queuine tRNA-ribosyltransferase accessory subunit 2 [Coccinella septempunctata]
MKFFVHSLTKCAPRIGYLAELNGKPNVSVQTPLVMLHTQGGQVPHITHEVLKLVNSNPHILQIPLVSVYNFKEAMEYFDGAINDFIGSAESICCLTLQDPSNLTQQGHNAKGKMPIWTKNGKVYYDSKTYMDTVMSFMPDMYHLLSDGDTNQSSPHKRLSKAVDNTILFHKECLEIHRNCEKLKDSLIIAPIAGGYSIPHRKKCLDSMLNDDIEVGGYLIDGLHNNGPEVEFLSFTDVQPIVEFSINNLPCQKLRAVQGCWNPVVVIKLVKLGVDIFDTSYCRMLTERSAAMTFPIESSEESPSYEINLRQLRYIDDFQPILQGCQCLACLKYSRGYIHHLLSVQELLGPVLIMIHNMHHYLRFFEKIRECIREGSLDQLELGIETHFRRYQQEILLPQKEPVVSDSLF